MVRCGLAVVAVAVALGGCGRAPSTPPPVRLAYQHEMVTLDPHAHDDSVTGSVLSAVYEGLVSFSPGPAHHHRPSRPRPAVCSSATTNPPSAAPATAAGAKAKAA